MKHIIFSAFLFIFLHCEDQSGDCPPENRTGCICKDGTTSTATGRGACSSHGGVKKWLCE